MKICVVVTGRSYHTSEKIPNEIELPDGASVGDAIDLISSHLTDEDRLPGSCLIAVSGDHLGTLSSCPKHQLKDGDELTLIAPVAGG